MNNAQHWSRLPGFFSLRVEERREVLSSPPVGIPAADFISLDQGLSLIDADRMSENVVGIFSLPFSVATNFMVDSLPVLVPMVTEEASIVAASSKMAKVVSLSDGFFTEVDRPLMKGQIQLYQLSDTDKALALFTNHKEELLVFLKSLTTSMNQRGGGAVDILARVLPSEKIGPMLLIEPVLDVVDAMGANMINTVLENFSDHIRTLFDGKIGLRILSNFCDMRLARARCSIHFRHLALDEGHDFGLALAEKMMVAHAFAEADIYRACTHNKGILNGVDAVALATGNDFRAIEAGAHAFAARTGHYQPLTSISLDHKAQRLNAELVLPLAVGVVGGISSVHEGVSLAKKMLKTFAHTSGKLASVMVSAGLSQCLAALLALCQDGIQKGHMKLHNKKLSGR